jgi:hypothetical protein
MFYSDRPEQDAQDYLRMIDSRKDAEPCCDICEITNVNLQEREVQRPTANRKYKTQVMFICDECFEWWQ